MILTSADYPEIRSAINPLMTEAQLPDSVIGQDIYVGVAEREVIARVPGALSLTGDDARRVRAAAIFLAAALIVPALPQVASENFGNYGYSIKPVDALKLAAILRARADTEIDIVLDPGTDEPKLDDLPIFFGTLHGSRGR